MATRPVVEHTPEAFERLYRRHVGDVYRYALAMVRDPAEAEDLTQTTFLRAWRAFSDGTTPRTPQNWFLRIAHNVLRTHFRDRSRRPRQVELPASLEAAVSAGPSAGDVLDALAVLPLSQREALVMRELEGRSYAEIAEILGVSRSAVEALIFRARRSLRVRRSDLGRLGAVQVPGSIASFFRERGLTETVGALVGSAGVVKAAAVVAAGVVAVGVGKEAADAVDDPPSGAPVASVEARPKLPPRVVVVRTAEALPRAAPTPEAVTVTAPAPAPSPAPVRSRADAPAARPAPPASTARRAVVAEEPAAPSARSSPVVERVEQVVEEAEKEAPVPALPPLPVDVPQDAPALPLDSPAPPPLPEIPLAEAPAAPEEAPLPSLP